MGPFEKWLATEIRNVTKELPTDAKTALKDFQAEWTSLIEQVNNLDLAVGEIAQCPEAPAGSKCVRCASDATREKILNAEEAIIIGLVRMMVLCAPMAKALPHFGGDRSIMATDAATELRRVAIGMGLSRLLGTDLIHTGTARGIGDEIDCAMGDLRRLGVVKSWHGDASDSRAIDPARMARLEGDSTPATNTKPTRRERRMKWLAEAMLTVGDHPEWSDAVIAKQVRIHKSRLSRSPEYKKAAVIARTPKTPDGSVTIVDRDRSVDAVDDSFNPNRPASRQWQDEEDIDSRLDREMQERNAKRNAKEKTGR